MNRKAWLIKKNAWEEIDDPLFILKGIPDESYGDDPRLEPRLEAIGYKNPTRLIDSKKVTADLYPGRDSHSPHPYVVIMIIAGNEEVIYVADLPSLLKLMDALAAYFGLVTGSRQSHVIAD